MLFCSYNIITLFFNQFGLAIKHGKSEVFLFSRSHGNFNLHPLSLSTLGDFVLQLKDILVLSLTGNYLFIKILIPIPTKVFQLLRA